MRTKLNCNELVKKGAFRIAVSLDDLDFIFKLLIKKH